MRLLRFVSLAFAALLVLGAGAIAGRPHAPAAPAWTAVVAQTPEGGYRMGNPGAPLKLIEYGSRSCPVCGRFYAEATAALRAKYIATGKVSYEFRDFPIHPQDIGNTLLGRCVPVAAFFPTLDRMYDGQRAFNDRAAALDLALFGRIQQLPRLEAARAWADTLGYTALMRQNGMSDAQVGQCFTQARVEALGNLVKTAVDKWGVEGTPTFLLNGKRLDNVFTWAQLEPMLQSKRG